MQRPKPLLLDQVVVRVLTVRGRRERRRECGEHDEPAPHARDDTGLGSRGDGLAQSPRAVLR
jgi:hypothetical protein